jgi:sec-independent protein translocase protein TatB
MWEIGLILIIALIFLGPRQLTETARVMGKWYRELQKMSWELRSSMDFDSMTSSTPPPSRKDTSSQTSDSVSPETEDPTAEPAAKPGPDFYGELLESSREDEKASSESSSSTDQEKRDTSDGKGAPKTGS